MHTNTARGTRRLLVAAGTMTLVLSVAAPTVVSASQPAGTPGQAPEGKVWVCHRTGNATPNPWELDSVSANAQGHEGVGHESDVWFDADHLPLLEAWATEAGLDLHQSDLKPFEARADEAQVAALMALCDAVAADQDDDDVVVVDDDVVVVDDDDDVILDDDDDVILDDDDVVVDDDVVIDDDDLVVVDDQSTGNHPPLPDPQISTDSVEKPVVQKPVVQKPVVQKPVVETPATETPVVEVPVVETPAAERPVVEARRPTTQSEVLGAITARTPTRELRTGAGVTSLPRTGTDSTTFLALVGGLLVATGLGLEALGRRGRLAAVGGRR